jgi:hypothetical protein
MNSCSHQRAHNCDTRLVFESDALGELQAVTSSVCERSQPVLVSWPSNASAAQDQEQEQEQELRDKLSSVLHIWPSEPSFGILVCRALVMLIVSIHSVCFASNCLFRTVSRNLIVAEICAIANDWHAEHSCAWAESTSRLPRSNNMNSSLCIFIACVGTN